MTETRQVTSRRLPRGKCPKCGSMLLAGAEYVWCSLVGCDFGVVGEPIKLRDWQQQQDDAAARAAEEERDA